jgi:hypothetical protein
MEREMTRISTKLSAVLIATVTIGGAVISSTDQASAMWRGERMGMGRMHHGHCCRGHGGFGRAMAIGAGIGIAGAIIAAAAAQPTFAESYDPQTGVRVRSEKRGANRVVTTKDANGKVVKREVKKPNEPDSASSTDPETGITTTSTALPGGGRKITKTDAAGKPIGKPVIVNNNEPASASATNTETGETTSVVDNGGGTRTITKTDGKGNVTEKRVEPNKTPDSASSTDPATGVTTTSISNGNGTRTVVQTNAQGQVLSTQIVQ